jgi:hypothetical protein
MSIFEKTSKLVLPIVLITLHTIEGQAIRISGTVKSQSGASLSGARVLLKTANLADTTGTDGAFIIQSPGTGIKPRAASQSGNRLSAGLHGGILKVDALEGSKVSLRVFSQLGQELFSGAYSAASNGKTFGIHGMGADVVIVRLQSGGNSLDVQGHAKNGSIQARISGVRGSALQKVSEEIPDSLVVTKDGFRRKAIHIGKSDTTGLEIQMTASTDLPKFSFFITSLVAMRRLSKNQNGFGGDLRYGETGNGAGLRGADKICTEIAESSMPGSGAKLWRAFLSVNQDENGQPVNAIDRIGAGPWHDRLGRLVGQNLTGLVKTRPDADPTIINDLPNETGEPNHDAGGVRLDNHDVLTGSNAQGRLTGNTCSNWTSVATSNGPNAGHSWPASSGQNWIQAHAMMGCAPSVVGGGFSGGVGDMGGYGAIYCFALSP